MSGVPQPGSESSRCNGPVGKSCWLLCPREWEEAGGGTMMLGGPRGYFLVRIWALRKTWGSERVDLTRGCVCFEWRGHTCWYWAGRDGGSPRCLGWKFGSCIRASADRHTRQGLHSASWAVSPALPKVLTGAL